MKTLIIVFEKICNIDFRFYLAKGILRFHYCSSATEPTMTLLFGTSFLITAIVTFLRFPNSLSFTQWCLLSIKNGLIISLIFVGLVYIIWEIHALAKWSVRWAKQYLLKNYD